jgi:primosomal protein N' (replication factor Y)
LAETAADEPKLSDAQEKLVETVNAAILSGTYSAFLLHGVTGSGKSLVYLEAVETAINSGKSAIVLVPEISLTPQLAGRMRRRFGEKVAITHSNISKKERLEVWRLARSGRIKVVIGPRSAVFSPLHDLGLIIVDEEHDNSYKQDYPAPLYNAKAVALYRASRNNATIILGSATPDVVSYHHAEQNRLRLLRLPERHGGAVKPGVRVVKWGGSLGGSVLSPQLKSRLDERLQRGEQTILLVNRRGFSTYIQCPKCGSVASCPNCDIPLKYHRIDTRLACHYCGYVQQVIDSCPECHTMRLKFTGIGTQKVERELELLYPGARIARMDFDTTQRSGEAFAILKGLAAGKYDILLGTQMVAKGHDFPNVTLVGVIGADGEMMQPDFRATERAFRLLLQAAGRTGRGQLMGEVVIQCLNPTEPMFRWVQNGDYHALYNSEIEHRRGLGYPPFGRLISLTASAEQGEYAGTAAQYLADELEQREIGFPVLGPAIPGIERLQGAFRRNLLVKLPPHSGRQVITAKAVIREAVVSTLKKFDREKLQIVIDVDPVEQ